LPSAERKDRAPAEAGCYSVGKFLYSYETFNPDGGAMDFFMLKNTTCRYIKILLASSLFLFIFLSLFTESAEASQARDQTKTAPSESERVSFDSALRDEKYDLAKMEQNLERWEILKNNTVNEIEAYRNQNTAHENLLFVLHTRNEILETALNNNRLAIKSLSERVVDFEKIGNTAPEWITQLSDRIAIAEKRMAELKQDKSTDADIPVIREKLKRLLDILYEKKKRSERFLKNYNVLFGKLKSTKSDLEGTRQRLEERLKSQEKSNLFERRLQPFTRLSPNRLAVEMKTAWYSAGGILKADVWQQLWGNFQRSGGIPQAIFLSLFLLPIIARKKILKFLHSAEQRLEGSTMSFRRLALTMLRRSFLLICAAVLLWLYDLLELPQINYSLGRFLYYTVITLLLTRWGIDYFKIRLGGSDSDLHLLVKKKLIHFFRLLRFLVIIHLLIISMFDSESASVWIFRLAIETFLFVWAVSFWRALDHMNTGHSRLGETAAPCFLNVAARGWGYMVFGGALLIDLIGYHALAVHWLVSWAETLSILLWAFISWLSIQEWHNSNKAAHEAREDGAVPVVALPLGWLLVQMARLLWLSALVAGILMAWAGSDFMVEALAKLFNLDLSAGSFRISLKGILLALIIFCVTHAAARIGRRLLSEKVLDSKDFERGLKDSIVTISSYVIWGLGILFALGVLGVNTTSLAVVFGALSIGIGFGLQNIFNNFISGLILLFERPIQVGDYVEVNNIWAEVKKINVRSTIVQTFDNATVIIPNSEFISQQVTNWSFKDPRMRRHVDVGVAYGSDIELVRRTLLEIPEHIPKILKHPRPDVLFMDHGDSALIFRLRFWINVDSYYASTTDVRFELDRRFRELGIEIAFPQRDLHIRSDHTRPFSKGPESGNSDPFPGQNMVPGTETE
jgi:potassium-dependent mechanosensitive channel